MWTSFKNFLKGRIFCLPDFLSDPQRALDFVHYYSVWLQISTRDKKTNMKLGYLPVNR